MYDYISKKEVINYARKCADGYSYIELPIDAFVDGINALPPADAVSREKYDKVNDLYLMSIKALMNKPVIVRCKDCKWWGGNKSTEHNNHLCKRAIDQDVEYWTKANDFCSYGERREP